MPDELPDECCGKCRFWSPPTENQLAENAESDGECLRYPPTLVMTDAGLENWFPDTADFDWCGEYQPSEPVE